MCLPLTHIAHFLRRLTLTIVHNLQLTFGMIYGRGLACPVLVDWPIFEWPAASTEGYVLACIYSLLIDCNRVWVISFFVRNCSDVWLVGYFAFIIVMWVTLQILQVLRLLPRVRLNVALHGHGTRRPVLDVYANAAASRFGNKLWGLFSVKDLITLNVS